MPYLETDQGRSCVLRQYFPSEVYWSQQFHENESGRSRGGTGVSCEVPSYPSDSKVFINSVGEVKQFDC